MRIDFSTPGKRIPSGRLPVLSPFPHTYLGSWSWASFFFLATVRSVPLPLENGNGWLRMLLLLLFPSTPFFPSLPFCSCKTHLLHEARGPRQMHSSGLGNVHLSSVVGVLELSQSTKIHSTNRMHLIEEIEGEGRHNSRGFPSNFPFGQK